MMADQSRDDIRFQNIVFLKAVVPVLKPIIAETPKLRKAFAGKHGVVQISALTEEGESIDGRAPRRATHLIVDGPEVTVKFGAHEAPNLEIEFPSQEKLNAFFTGTMNLPKIHGALSNAGLLVATVQALLRMSSLLGATEAPKDPDEAALLTKCMFYLLSTGISQLNKAGHPAFRKWAKKQPDRVYAFVVKDRPDLGAYVRVKAGRTKAARGQYTRSKPFFAMQFSDPAAALGILLDTDDMIEATVAGRIAMLGAPEYGAELGDLMLTVGGYAK